MRHVPNPASAYIRQIKPSIPWPPVCSTAPTHRLDVRVPVGGDRDSDQWEQWGSCETKDTGSLTYISHQERPLKSSGRKETKQNKKKFKPNISASIRYINEPSIKLASIQYIVCEASLAVETIIQHITTCCSVPALFILSYWSLALSVQKLLALDYSLRIKRPPFTETVHSLVKLGFEWCEAPPRFVSWTW